MTIALTMIVKNEEAVIERCLNSVKDQIDYWVIADTGSSDNTKEIIETTLSGIPGEIIDVQWEGFGHARTQALKAVKGQSDWILVMDADFELKGEIDTGDFTAEAIKVGFEGDLSWYLPLLFRNDRDWYYEGRVHEFLTADTLPTLEKTDSFVIVNHGDGQDSEGYMTDRLHRNLKLLQGSQETARNCFYLGETYRQLNMPDRAVEWYQKCIDYNEWEEEVFLSKYHIALFEDSFERYLEAWNYLPRRIESLYRAAVIARKGEKYNIAWLLLNVCHAKALPEDSLFVEKKIYEFMVAFEMSIVAYYVDEKAVGEALCNSLLEREDLPDDLREQVEKNLTFYQ